MEITGIITAIIFGAAIGGLGRLVAPGRHQFSLLVTILVGIVAAVLGTAVAGFIGVADTPGSTGRNWRCRSSSRGWRLAALPLRVHQHQ